METAHHATSKHQLLLVEGRLDRRQRLYDLLSAHGLSVSAAPTGRLALEILKHERPELLVIGAELTDMTGEHLMAQVRLFDAMTPIILLGRDGQSALPSLACVELPSTASDERLLAAIQQQFLKPAAQPAEPMGTILLVDDDRRLSSILHQFLELSGFRIVTVNSGEEAIEQLASCAPRVVLLDVRMPGMDGLLTLKKLRMAQPNLPVIVVTQVEEEGVREEALALGALDYLVKPLNFEHLKSVLLTRIFT